MNRIIRDLMFILLILIMPMRLMELLGIDTFLLSIIAESGEEITDTTEELENESYPNVD